MGKHKKNKEKNPSPLLTEDIVRTEKELKEPTKEVSKQITIPLLPHHKEIEPQTSLPLQDGKVELIEKAILTPEKVIESKVVSQWYFTIRRLIIVLILILDLIYLF